RRLGLHRGRVPAAHRGVDQPGRRRVVVGALVQHAGAEDAELGRVGVVGVPAEVLHRPLVDVRLAARYRVVVVVYDVVEVATLQVRLDPGLGGLGGQVGDHLPQVIRRGGVDQVERQLGPGRDPGAALARPGARLGAGVGAAGDHVPAVALQHLDRGGHAERVRVLYRVGRGVRALGNGRHRAVGQAAGAAEERLDVARLVLQVRERLPEVQLGDDVVEVAGLVQEVVRDVREPPVGVAEHVVARLDGPRLLDVGQRQIAHVDAAG